jgi:glycosyltransferase involved in cell wall biosynthesis
MAAVGVEPPDLSVVIPIKNEAANLEGLVYELRDVLTAWGRPYEVILIDDGSTDNSLEIMRRLQRDDAHLRIIQFRRNFGQTAAFAAGFAYARGRLIATSDGDLQNDPRDIPPMVAQLETRDDDIVCACRRSSRIA